MKSIYLARIAVLLATLGVAASACAQWVWLDEHGVKQFTDVAPPGNIPKDRILKTPRGNNPAAAKPDSSADKPADASASSAPKEPMTTAEKEADYKKRKLEQAEKDKKAAEDAKRAQVNADNCAHAKAYADSLSSGVRISTTDSSGQRSFLSDDDRTKELARAHETLSGCN